MNAHTLYEQSTFIILSLDSLQESDFGIVVVWDCGIYEPLCTIRDLEYWVPLPITMLMLMVVVMVIVMLVFMSMRKKVT